MAITYCRVRQNYLYERPTGRLPTSTSLYGARESLCGSVLLESSLSCPVMSTAALVSPKVRLKVKVSTLGDYALRYHIV